MGRTCDKSIKHLSEGLNIQLHRPEYRCQFCIPTLIRNGEWQPCEIPALYTDTDLDSDSPVENQLLTDTDPESDSPVENQLLTDTDLDNDSPVDYQLLPESNSSV